MEMTYAFVAGNAPTSYGYGTEREALLFLEHLNRNREINLYQVFETSLTDEEADAAGAINLMEETITPQDLTSLFPEI